MSAKDLLENEIRTLTAELCEARGGAQDARVRLLNSQMSHEAQIAELTDRLKRAESTIRRDQGVSAASPVVAPPASKPVKPEAQVVTDFMSNQVRRAQVTGAAAQRMTVNVGLGPDFFYGSQHHKDVRVMEQIALKNASLRARDAISRSTSNLLLDYAGVLAIARACRAGLIDAHHARAFRTWVPRSLLSLARVVADQALLPQDPVDAADLYRLAVTLWGFSSLDQRALLVFSDLLDQNGDHAEMLSLWDETDFVRKHPVQRALHVANHIMRTDGPSEAWLGSLNSELEAANLASVTLAPGAGDLLARLGAEAPAVTEGPMVTVMMPTHNGSAHILTAIRSVLSQSWRNLELIVVDDHSREEEWDYLRRNAPDDRRLTLTRLDSNQGAYRARLKAFSLARGEFATVHDDDDWSHPQKIEWQVNHLLQDPDVIANMSYQTRIDQDGLFLRINDNPEFNQRNYSSMMIRTADVLRLGMWDDLNRAADAEFHDRVFAATGKRVAAVTSPPLSFMRARSGSLTSGEIRKGALDFGRQTYGLLYQNWHLRLKAGDDGAAGSPPDFSSVRRPFPVPQNFLSGQRRPDLGKFDVVYCTDFRFPGGNSSLTNAEVRAAKDAGLRVGVLHLSSPVLRAPRPFNREIAETISELDVPVMAMEDEMQTSVLVVRNPTVLEYADNLRSAVRSDRTVLVANTAPMSVNGTDACYDITHCAQSALAAFGAPVEVAPESPHTRALLHALAPETPLAIYDWPGFISDDAIGTHPRTVRTGRPVVGRHSRDHRLKWPDTREDVSATYIGGGEFDTQVLGGADSIQSLIRLEEHGVTVHPFGTIEPLEFVQGVDFWVYMHSSKLVESFGMATLEAMATGCVVILPPYMEPLFGSGARYASPSEVRELVLSLWSDGEAFSAQSAAALEVARSRFSTSAYLGRLRRIVAQGIEEADTDGV